MEPDSIPAEVLSVLGSPPRRWGRMDLLSRLAVVGVGRLLQKERGLDEGNRIPQGQNIGLVAGTRYGSLVTDLAFAQTIVTGEGNPSPLLFGYTLPNIALSEAASHFGIRGPVYSVFSSEEPLVRAREEAMRLLQYHLGISAMIAGELDVFPAGDKVLAVKFELVV